MDLSQIRAFLAVAKEGSFTKASKLLNLSQPSISLKVKALEKDLGSTLLFLELPLGFHYGLALGFSFGAVWLSYWSCVCFTLPCGREYL